MPYPGLDTDSIFGGISSNTYNTSVAETSIVPLSRLGTITLPPNFLTPGSTLRAKACGVLSHSGATTRIFKFKIGAVTYTSNTFTAAGALTNSGWYFEMEICCRTNGAAGTIQGQGIVAMYTVAGAAPLSVELRTIGTDALDTTIANLVDLTNTHGTSNAADGITCQQFTLELLN